MPNINRIHLPDGNTYDLVKKELTQAEYNALTEEEKNNGTVYLINDVSSSRIDIETLINIIYPVGSIYISVTDDTVAKVEARFGGTWEAFGAGRTLVGVDPNDTSFDTVEETGGEKTHTLTTAEMPAHNGHLLGNDTAAGGSLTEDTYYMPMTSVTKYSNNRPYIIRAGNEVVPRGITIGTNGAHNNLQPYITTYMYKRTA